MCFVCVWHIGKADNGPPEWLPFSDHVAELNNVRPKQPFFFLKPPSSLVLPGAGPCIRPKGVDLHYEVELALVMGKEVKDFKEEDEQGALDAIESMPGLPFPTSRDLETFPPSLTSGERLRSRH